MIIILGILLIGVAVLTVLMSLQESRKRKISVWIALLICIITSPFLGYFIISTFGLRNPIGCKWCGNTLNEAEYCGVCHKNETGQMTIK